MGGDAETIRKESHDAEARAERRLAMRWNDQLIWFRGMEAVHALHRAVVPPRAVEGDGNTLTLENRGTRPLPLDAVWVEPLERGEYPYYVAAEDAHWLNRRDADWVRTVNIRLPIPRGPFEAATFPAHPPRDPLLCPGELAGRWREAEFRFRVMEEAGHPSVPALRVWRRDVGRAAARGMLPAVELPRPEPEEAESSGLEAALYVYGDVIQRWTLPRGARSLDPLARKIRETRPGVEVVRSHTVSDTEGFPVLSRRFIWGWDEYVPPRAAQRLAWLEGGGADSRLAEGLNRSLWLRSTFSGYLPHSQWHHANRLHFGVLQHLMDSDRGVTLHDTFPGGTLFPGGDDAPGPMWMYVRNLFRFGGPGHRKGHANLVTDEGVRDLLRTYWAVADNGRDSVQVLVHNDWRMNGNSATLSLPLPWEGPTDVLHHHVEMKPSRGEAPESAHARLTREARGGWLEIPFEYRGIHLFELHPAGYRDERRNLAPERVGASELRESRDLFRVGTSPPPPWWSRQTLTQNVAYRWRELGTVSFQAPAPVTRGQTPDWEALRGLNNPVQTLVERGSPLNGDSVRFRFAEKEEGKPRVVRAVAGQHQLGQGERVGIWLRANPPPGYRPAIPWAAGAPRTRFYMGTLPYRQLVEVEYNRWYFITSETGAWRNRDTQHDPYLLFWPADPADGNPEIEVNAVDLYQVKLGREQVNSTRSLGYVNTDGAGNVQVLLLGVPGTPGAWRQHLPFLVEAGSFRPVVDPALLTTAETPEEDPPEVVRHRVRILEESRMVEVNVERMPETPSEAHLLRIERHFPLMSHAIRTHRVGALLLDSTPEAGR